MPNNVALGFRDVGTALAGGFLEWRMFVGLNHAVSNRLFFIAARILCTVPGGPR